MSNKDILDTFIVCGRLSLDSKSYGMFCESEIDIENILKLYNKYKKECKLEVVISILYFILDDIKNKVALGIIYRNLLNLIEISLKYDLRHRNIRDTENSIYRSIQNMRVREKTNAVIFDKPDNVNKFDAYMSILNNQRVIYVRALIIESIELDGVRYNIVADENATMLLDNGETCDEKITLISLRVDKVDIIKTDDMSEVYSMLKNRNDCIHIIRAGIYINTSKG